MVLTSALTQLDLGLALELRIGQLDADDRRQTLRAYRRPVKSVVALLEHALLARIVVDGACQRRAKAGQMRAAVGGVDGVGKGVDRFVVAIGVLQRGLDQRALDLRSM